MNPRLWKIRDGLDELALPADELLGRGAPRLVYRAALVENLRNYLLGIEKRPKYILSQRGPKEATQRIVGWWAERWAARRLAHPDALQRMAQHTLDYPIEHGARVVLPKRDDDQQELF